MLERVELLNLLRLLLFLPTLPVLGWLESRFVPPFVAGN